jgi:UDPglucose 6-dehydrogenase
MILGDSVLADGARAMFGDVPFYWVLDHPTLLPIGPRLQDAPDGSLVVISTPVLFGTIRHLEADFPQFRFAYVPENVRQAHPEDWKTQARFVIGARDSAAIAELSETFAPALVMSPESAEMTKHALNGFLALSCDYAVRIGRLAEKLGADPDDVALGMMSDPRIGSGAYLKPSGTLGPNLQREVDNLEKLGL